MENAADFFYTFARILSLYYELANRNVKLKLFQLRSTEEKGRDF